MAEESATRKPTRDHIAAMQTQRAFKKRVREDPSRTLQQMDVADALLELVTSYSRTTDRVSRAQIAEVAGVSQPTVTRTLKKWHEKGWITWEPSTTRGVMSVLTVHEQPRITQGDATATENHGSPMSDATNHESATLDQTLNHESTETPESPDHESAMGDSLPERKPSVEKAAARAGSPDPETEDELAGLADRILYEALPLAGCSRKRWTSYPVADRDRLEQAVDATLRSGQSAQDVFDVLSVPSDVQVLRWPQFLLSRLQPDKGRRVA